MFPLGSAGGGLAAGASADSRLLLFSLSLSLSARRWIGASDGRWIGSFQQIALLSRPPSLLGTAETSPPTRLLK